jgi:hypothetical protein
MHRKSNLVPATGSRSGFEIISDALAENNIAFIEAPETLPLGEPKFREYLKPYQQ